MSAVQVPVGVLRTFDEWAFEKKYALLTQVRMHSFVSTALATTYDNWTFEPNAEGRMHLKLTMLFLLIGFVVGLPYFFEKIWAIWKGEAGNRHH